MLAQTMIDWALVNVKLKLVVIMLINKLSLIWPISLYTGHEHMYSSI